MTPVSPEPLSFEQTMDLRRLMLSTYFAGFARDYLVTPEGLGAIEAQTTGRYYDCLRDVVPWVARHTELASARVIEVGCGAGASTAAFAQHCGHITGIDIDDKAIEAAKARMGVLGLTNVELLSVSPDTFLDAVRASGAGGVDVVFLYAVLEHQTLQERLETLRLSWGLLKDQGLLVVADTPNRLTFSDLHTSMLPFFHTLPHDLAIAYSAHSPRPTFVQSIADALRESPAAAEERLIRWGRGVSYHEFELALGPLNEIVVGDGFDPEMRRSKPVTLDERLLFTYAKATGLTVPAAFFRQSIDVVLRKGNATPHSSAAEQVLQALT